MARIRYEFAHTEGGLLPPPSDFPCWSDWEAACDSVRQERAEAKQRRKENGDRRELEETWTELKKRRQWWKVSSP